MIARKGLSQHDPLSMPMFIYGVIVGVVATLLAEFATLWIVNDLNDDSSSGHQTATDDDMRP